MEPSILFYRIKYKISTFIDEIRHRAQRAKKGYSTRDVWDIDMWFIETMKPMLEEYLEHNCGYPDDEFDSEEEWNKVIKEMIWYLNEMDYQKKADELFKKYGTFMPAEDKNIMDIYNECEEYKNHFFELFSKYFHCLWW